MVPLVLIPSTHSHSHCNKFDQVSDGAGKDSVELVICVLIGPREMRTSHIADPRRERGLLDPLEILRWLKGGSPSWY